VHLPAAGLLDRELDLVAEALEDLDRRLPRLREERVVEAGYEERYAHCLRFTSSPQIFCRIIAHIVLCGRR
jgi:hypothetical protein